MMKILLVDDHEVVRVGLKALLSSHDDFEVVAEAATAEEAIAKTNQYKPDVVVMDIRLPGRNGIEATREILEDRPDTKIIMLTSFADDDLLFEAISAGASGYVLKQIGSQELVDALQKVGRGDSLIGSRCHTESVAAGTPGRASGGGRSLCYPDRTGNAHFILAVRRQERIKRSPRRSSSVRRPWRNYVSSILSKLNLSTRF